MQKGKRLQEPYQPNFSLIHQLDARVKVIFTLAFIIFLNLTPSKAWPAYILFLSMILSMTLLARLGLRFVLLRAFMAIPFVLAAFPLVFTGPLPHSNLFIINNVQVTYSPEGFARFASITIKAWISIQAAILLAAATHFPDLLIALKQLKIPQLFVAIIGLMWRYLFVISEEVTRMNRARASRSAVITGSHHSGSDLFWRARVTGGMAGSLFLRSLERSDRVYSAMLSRGYSGDLPPSENIGLPRKEKWILVLVIFSLAFLSTLGLITGG